MINYQYRLRPTIEQQRQLWSHANALNRLYNRCLDERIKAFEKDKSSISCFDQIKAISRFREDDPVLKEVFVQSAQQAVRLLNISYKAFFIRKFGFPKFRACRNFFPIIYPQPNQGGFKIIDDHHVKLTPYGIIKTKFHRKFVGEISQVTITCKDNVFYLNVFVNEEVKLVAPKDTIVGVDVGITNFIAASNGDTIKSPSFIRYYDKTINQLKSKRDLEHPPKKDKNGKVIKVSRRFKQVSKVIQRLYSAKSRRTKDFLHKVSHTLASTYDTVVVEDLKIKQMSEGKITGLNRELRNACIARLFSMLEYKVHTLIKVDPYNTSKACHCCGYIHEMPLYRRTFICPNCGEEIDRDVNAAKNILNLGRYRVSCDGVTYHLIPDMMLS